MKEDIQKQESGSRDSFRLALDDKVAAAKAAEYKSLLRTIKHRITKPVATIARFCELPALGILRQCRAEVSNLDLDLAALEALLIRDFPKTGDAK